MYRCTVQHKTPQSYTGKIIPTRNPALPNTSEIQPVSGLCQPAIRGAEAHSNSICPVGKKPGIVSRYLGKNEDPAELRCSSQLPVPGIRAPAGLGERLPRAESHPSWKESGSRDGETPAGLFLGDTVEKQKKTDALAIPPCTPDETPELRDVFQKHNLLVSGYLHRGA